MRRTGTRRPGRERERGERAEEEEEKKEKGEEKEDDQKLATRGTVPVRTILRTFECSLGSFVPARRTPKVASASHRIRATLK